jgi:hypothetical protein
MFSDVGFDVFLCSSLLSHCLDEFSLAEGNLLRRKVALPSLRASLRWWPLGGILKEEKKATKCKEEKMKWMVTIVYLTM